MTGPDWPPCPSYVIIWRHRDTLSKWWDAIVTAISLQFLGISERDGRSGRSWSGWKTGAIEKCWEPSLEWKMFFKDWCDTTRRVGYRDCRYGQWTAGLGDHGWQRWYSWEPAESMGVLKKGGETRALRAPRQNTTMCRRTSHSHLEETVSFFGLLLATFGKDDQTWHHENQENKIEMDEDGWPPFFNTPMWWRPVGNILAVLTRNERERNTAQPESQSHTDSHTRPAQPQPAIRRRLFNTAEAKKEPTTLVPQKGCRDSCCD